MNVALLSKYSRLGASSRLRILQYISHLEKAGIEVQVLPLFDEAYLLNLYSGKGRYFRSIVDCYRKRMNVLHKLKDVDLIWLEKESFPYLPYWLEWLKMPARIPYVVDYDDAVFHSYDLSKNLVVRKLLGSKIDKIMANAAIVVCGNNYLAARANQAGAKHIEILPTVLDASRYRPGHVGQNMTALIGWIGSPSTQKYILDIQHVLQHVCNDYESRLVLVGANQELIEKLSNISLEIIPWDEATEPETISGLDIGIMPLPDTPWARGKCGFKLIQYMACGLPVVASPVGVNKEIVEHGVNGFLAETNVEWVQALSTLRNNPELRKRMGEAGRRKVEEKYSLQVTAPRLIKIIRSLQGKS